MPHGAHTKGSVTKQDNRRRPCKSRETYDVTAQGSRDWLRVCCWRWQGCSSATPLSRLSPAELISPITPYHHFWQTYDATAALDFDLGVSTQIVADDITLLAWKWGNRIKKELTPDIRSLTSTLWFLHFSNAVCSYRWTRHTDWVTCFTVWVSGAVPWPSRLLIQLLTTCCSHLSHHKTGHLLQAAMQRNIPFLLSPFPPFPHLN